MTSYSSHGSRDTAHELGHSYLVWDNTVMEGLVYNASKLAQIFADGTRLSYRKGDVIIRPEDIPQGVFYIESGYVKTYAITKYAEENLLIIRQQGEVFPIIWALADEHAEVFYEAMTDAVLHRISRSQFLNNIKSEADFSDIVLQQTVEMYRVHAERVNNLAYRTAGERVAYRLLMLAKRFGQTKSNGEIHIPLPLRQQDIAASVRISRETASREIAKLERRNIVRSQDGIVVVCDRNKLKRLVS